MHYEATQEIPLAGWDAIPEPEASGTRLGAIERPQPAALEARDISAWFGDAHVLDRVSLLMEAGEVTSLIGPSGCGKSTFLRILNRMHELAPTASLAGEVLLDGRDIYSEEQRLTEARREARRTDVYQIPQLARWCRLRERASLRGQPSNVGDVA